MAKMTEAERQEYNRDCDKLKALRIAYHDFERRFDEKWNPELVEKRKRLIEASGFTSPNPMYAYFHKAFDALEREIDRLKDALQKAEDN